MLSVYCVHYALSAIRLHHFCWAIGFYRVKWSLNALASSQFCSTEQGKFDIEKDNLITKRSA